MALKDTLKLKLPIYQQGNESLDDLLDAVGELLDNFKTAIDDIQNYNDFELIPEKLIEDLAKQFDVEFPRNMSESRKRGYLREIITLYRSTGTKVSMERVFRLIGWEVDIAEYYIVDPAYSSFPLTLTNDSGGSFNLSLYDRIEGTNPTYKNGQVFTDLVDAGGNVFPARQIYGQKYEVDDEVTFMKVPYIKIKVTSEDFDLFTADYVEDGNAYAYDSSEEFEILESIKSYFLERIRPASVAIIEITTPFSLSDNLSNVSEGLGEGSATTEAVTFDLSANTIVLTAGSWKTLGFHAGDTITISNSASNDGSYKIKSLSGATASLYLPKALTSGADNIDIVNSYYGAMTVGRTGADLVTNGDFANNVDSWTALSSAISYESGVLRVTVNAGAAAFGYQSVTTVIGKSYRVIATCTANITGVPRTYLGNSAGNGAIANVPMPVDVPIEYIFTATATTTFVTFRVDSAVNGEYSEFDNVSVKEFLISTQYDGSTAYGSTVDRYILGEQFGGIQYGNDTLDYYGVDDIAPAEQYTRSYPTLTTSPELVKNGTFDFDSLWTKASNWAITGGEATFTPSDAASQRLEQNIGLISGTTYHYTYDIVVTTGTFVLYFANGVPTEYVSATGSYHGTYASGPGGSLIIFALAGFTGTLDNVSVKLVEDPVQQNWFHLRKYSTVTIDNIPADLSSSLTLYGTTTNNLDRVSLDSPTLVAIGTYTSADNGTVVDMTGYYAGTVVFGNTATADTVDLTIDLLEV